MSMSEIVFNQELGRRILWVSYSQSLSPRSSYLC